MLVLMNPMRNLRTLRVPLLWLALVCLPRIACGQETPRRPYRFLIPDGYVGWVKVEFNVKGAPPLLFKDGCYTFEVPTSGRFQTSSDEEFGLARDQYYYVAGDSKRRLVSDVIIDDVTIIWKGYGGSLSTSNSTEKPYKYVYFFVGPKAEYEKYKCKHAGDCLDPDESGDPRIGNKKLNG
jgi:hypothetical protein